MQPRHAMNPTRLLRLPDTRCAALLLFAAALGGCSSLGGPGPASGAASETVAGNYEVLAGCVAEAGDKSVGGAPVLRVDRERKVATVRRVLQPSNALQYELSFTQSGAATVQVEGRSVAASSDATRAFAFVWPHVGLCATNVMAP